MTQVVSKNAGCRPCRPLTGPAGTFGVGMRTQSEIEVTIYEGMTRFEQEYMDRGPKEIRAHLIGDLVVVRLRGLLTAPEQQLAKSLPPEKGRDLLKQLCRQMVELARP